MTRKLKIYHSLRPFGWIYGLVTSIRNLLFDSNIVKSRVFPIPIINIGNITVGGTGKTPHTEYTASLLQDKYKTAVLSRGYGRLSKGFILSDDNSDSSLIGDEPMQIKQRFPMLDVAVCEDRGLGITRLMERRSPQVVLLDDAFQHRKVTPSLNILLINYHRNILHDTMLPAGRLRENAKGRDRADIIIVSKCPQDISNEEMLLLAHDIITRPEQQVYFTTLQYKEPYRLDGNGEMPLPCNAQVLAVTGIAQPELMLTELQNRGHKVTLMKYADHHRFTPNDIMQICGKLNSMGQEAIIVTTAKDAARLSTMKIDPSLLKRIYVLPIGVQFLRDGGKFEQTIIQHIESYNKKIEK